MMWSTCVVTRPSRLSHVKAVRIEGRETGYGIYTSTSCSVDSMAENLGFISSTEL